MKRPRVLALLAIPLALSSCLTEPEPGPAPPEDDAPPLPERPIARPDVRPIPSPLAVEREYRVQAQPPDFPPGGSVFTLPWDPIVKHSDTLAIGGDGDVHVIGNHTWFHFPALGGPPAATVLHQLGVFDTPFAVAMRGANDPDPAIAALRGQNYHPVMRRLDSVTHTVAATCDYPAPNSADGNWRFTQDADGFWITGKEIILCSLDGAPLAIQPREGRTRHPHNSTQMPGYVPRSLEVSQHVAGSGTSPHGSTALRYGAGTAIGTRSLMFDTGVITTAVWGAVEPGASTGYALAADRVEPCPPPQPSCMESNYAIVPVSMTDGAHGERVTGPRLRGTVIGGMIVIDPLSHDLYVLSSHMNADQSVRTFLHRYRVLATGALALAYWDEMPGTNVHDAIIVGEDLYISLFTGSGARLQMRSLAGDLRADVTYGSAGDYPMALKKSFASEPYYLIKEGNELVVRKLGVDTDADGLLDRWETMGMDFNHDGQIDYALHQVAGINPLRKNIILELDVAAGATDPRIYWSRIHQMFLDAPVTNPDGSTGITATLLFSESFDGSSLPANDSEELWQAAMLFGDPGDRSSPNEEAILEARFMATRHVLVFPYRRISARGGTMLGQVYGRPGHASHVIAIYDLFGATLQAIHDALPTEGRLTLRASIFTHELGHALGLQHGGHDPIEFKPNYHSVMNLMRIVPRGWPLVAPDLTFADTPGPTLVEDRLYERVGLGMNYTHDGHMVPYFSGPPGGPYQQLVGFETGPIFDFDGDGDFETASVIADLTRDRELTALAARADWPEIDWSLHASPGWMDAVPMSGTAADEEETLLVAGGFCDPLAAAGCTCTVEGQTRPCGTDVGVCAAGVQTCRNGFWGLCEGSVPAFAERCDAADDDCDGTTDEAFPTLGQPCTAGVGACARSGSQVCSADQRSATCSVVAGDPTAERCSNSVDDDCDGATDEGYPSLGQACSVGVGVCRRDGTNVCGADGVSATCSATAGTPGAEACGNGLDDDCDGLTDENCLPAPISPPSGHLTGSGRLTSVVGLYNPKQVTFRWAATTPGATYELQIDDAPSFSSPWITTTSATSHTSPDLVTSGVVPFGTRHHWRVRSRVNAQQPWGPWSASRYVDVGRLPDDVNGDGYADVVVGATNAAHTPGVTGEGAAFVYHGRSGGIPYNGTPARTIDDPLDQAYARFGSSFGLADLDADGFTDVVVGIPGRTVTTAFGTHGSAGAIAIYFGGSAGLSTPPVHVVSPVPETGAGFGAAIAPAGDVDGDGYADFWVAAPDQDAMIYWNGYFTNQPSVGAAYLYRGGPRASFPTVHADSRIGWAPSGRFGAAMRGVGDVDDDGTTDVAFAAPGAGRVFVYRGGSTALLANLTWAGSVNFGRDLAAGDVDGDGGVDLVVTMTSPAGYLVFRKSGATLGPQPWYGDVGGPSAYDAFVAAGDVDRDGDADLALGYPSISPGGRVVLYLGGASPGIPGHWTDAQSYAELGRSLTLADTMGDGRHDIFAGAPRAYLTATAPREGKMLGWSMTGTPAFGHAPTVIYDSPRNQAEGWFGQSMR